MMFGRERRRRWLGPNVECKTVSAMVLPRWAEICNAYERSEGSSQLFDVGLPSGANLSPLLLVVASKSSLWRESNFSDDETPDTLFFMVSFGLLSIICDRNKIDQDKFSFISIIPHVDEHTYPS